MAVGRWGPDGCETHVAVVIGAFPVLGPRSWAPTHTWMSGLHESHHSCFLVLSFRVPRGRPRPFLSECSWLCTEVERLLAAQLVAGLEGRKRRTRSPPTSVPHDAPTSLPHELSPDPHRAAAWGPAPAEGASHSRLSPRVRARAAKGRDELLFE